MDKLFREFLMEKEYVCGLAQTTLKTYRATLEALRTRLGENDPAISKETFLRFVKISIEHVISPTTINYAHFNVQLVPNVAF